MGTRFVASEESGAHPRYKELIVAAGDDGTVLTDEFSVMWPDAVTSAGVLRHALDTAAASPDEIVGHTPVGDTVIDIPRFGVPPPTHGSTGNIDAMALYAGEGAGAVTRIQAAAEIVRDIETQAGALLGRALVV